MEAGLPELRQLVAAAGRAAIAPGRLYLVSRTSHLAEGWCDRVPALELAADADGGALGDAVREAGRSLGVDVVWESPTDVIPLPQGWQERSRVAGLSGRVWSGLQWNRHLHLRLRRPRSLRPSSRWVAESLGQRVWR